jgi:uncharacterized Fe-S center protein
MAAIYIDNFLLQLPQHCDIKPRRNEPVYPIQAVVFEWDFSGVLSECCLNIR